MTGHQQSIWSVGIDDKLRAINVGPKVAASFSPYVLHTRCTSTLSSHYVAFCSSIYPLSSQAKAIATSPSDGHIFVAGISSIEVLRGTQKVTSLTLKYNCASIAVATSNIVAVGGEVS